MSPHEPLADFERNVRVVLERSVTRIDGRTRSRLNQARQAALQVLDKPRRAWWRSYTLMPTAGAAVAALLVAVVLWHREPSGEPLEVRPAAVEDMDLLADSDALELLDNWDGPFYEWAVAQSDANGETEG